MAKQEITICDKCGLNVAVPVTLDGIYYHREFSGSCGYDYCCEKLELCRRCAENLLSYLYKDHKDDLEYGQRLHAEFKRH